MLQDEHIAATVATEVAGAYNSTRAAVFLVQVRSLRLCKAVLGAKHVLHA